METIEKEMVERAATKKTEVEGRDEKLERLRGDDVMQTNFHSIKTCRKQLNRSNGSGVRGKKERRRPVHRSSIVPVGRKYGQGCGEKWA